MNKYELNLELEKGWSYPINSYLNKKGNETHLESGHILEYGKYIDNNQFENEYKLELQVVIGGCNQYNSLKVALVDNKNNRLAIQDTNIKTLIPGEEHNFKFNYNNDDYIVNFKTTISTEIKTDGGRSNFEIEKSYPNEYANVYFRVNAPYYQHSNNYNYTQEQNDDFYNEVYHIFKELGWEITEQKGCDYINKGKQKLYLHPQAFSGEVLKNEIVLIHAALQNGKTFNSRWTDVYEDLFDITKEEYLKMLESKQTEIEKDILEIYKTKRKNLYITDTWAPLQNVLNKYKVRRLGNRLGLSSGDIDYNFMINVLDKLIAQNKIVTADTKNGKGYRTINKTEQKELKIAI